MTFWTCRADIPLKQEGAEIGLFGRRGALDVTISPLVPASNRLGHPVSAGMDAACFMAEKMERQKMTRNNREVSTRANRKHDSLRTYRQAEVRRRRQVCVAAAAAMASIASGGLLSRAVLAAANDAWSTNPGSANFSGTTNWTINSTTPGTGNGTATSGDALFFGNSTLSGNSTSLTLNNDDTNFTAAGLTFNAGATAAYTINGNSFTLTGGITNSSTNLEIINNAIATTAARTITMTSGGGNISLGGNISGTGGGLTLAGTGVLTLSGTNSFTGTTTVNATGTLVYKGSAAMSSSSAISTSTGATLSLLSDTERDLYRSKLSPGGGSTTTFNVGPVSGGGDNSLTFSPTATTSVGSTTMTFNVTGSSGDRLILSGGDLNFTGGSGQGLVLNPTTGNLTVSKNISGGAGTVTGTLTLDGNSTSNLFSGNITNRSGTVSVTKSNSSIWTLSGTNSYSGTTSVTGGTLVYQGSSAMSSNSSISPSTGVTLSLLSDGNATFNAAGFGPSGGATVTLNVGPISTGSGNSLTFNSTATSFVGSNSMTFNVTGSSGDRLILSGGDLTLTNNAGQSLTLNPTTANLTVTKNFNGGNSTGNADTGRQIGRQPVQRQHYQRGRHRVGHKIQ